MNNKTTFKVKNCLLETPKFWSRLSKATLTVSSGLALAIRGFHLSADTEGLITAIAACVALTITAMTQFFAEEKK